MSVPKKPVAQYSPDYPGYDEGRRNFLLLLGGSASSVLLGAAGCKEEASQSGAKKKPEPKAKPDKTRLPGEIAKPEPPTLGGVVKAKPDRPRPPGGLRHKVEPPMTMEIEPRTMEPDKKAMKPDMRPAPTKAKKSQ